MRITGSFIVRTMALTVAILLAPPGMADERRERRGGETDVHQDEVLEALKRGRIRPLAEVLGAAEKIMPGQVLGVKMKRKEGRLVYELKILAGGGRVREIYVDAASLEILQVE
jgi:uncharacterized membrane protein YkoI